MRGPRETPQGALWATSPSRRHARVVSPRSRPSSETMPLLRQDAPRGTRNPGADFCRASPVLLRRRLLRRFDPREGGQTTAPEAAPRRPWAGTSPRRETSDRNPGDRALSWLRALSCGEPYRAESLIVRKSLSLGVAGIEPGTCPLQQPGDPYDLSGAPALTASPEAGGSCRGGRIVQRRTGRAEEDGSSEEDGCPPSCRLPLSGVEPPGGSYRGPWYRLLVPGGEPPGHLPPGYHRDPSGSPRPALLLSRASRGPCPLGRAFCPPPIL